MLVDVIPNLWRFPGALLLSDYIVKFIPTRPKIVLGFKNLNSTIDLSVSI